MGLQEDTGLSSSQYTLLGSIYYAGYMPAVPFHNRMFQIFPPAKYIACCVVIWGAVLACMSACHNFAGLMVQRTALGMLEASINCGFSMITASWYRKYEHGTRVGLWSGMTGIATILGGLIAYGCVAGEEKHPSVTFTSWKLLSLCTGLVSVVYGACMLYFMAGSVVTARFFTEEEKTLAVERLRDNHQGVGSNQYKKYQLIEAWTDYRVCSISDLNLQIITNLTIKLDLDVCRIRHIVSNSSCWLDSPFIHSNPISRFRHQDNSSTSNAARRHHVYL
jgi:ACS family allantoate permease-like MFS transporter